MQRSRKLDDSEDWLCWRSNTLLRYFIVVVPSIQTASVRGNNLDTIDYGGSTVDTLHEDLSNKNPNHNKVCTTKLKKKIPWMKELEALQHVHHVPSHRHPFLGPTDKAWELAPPN